MNSRARDGTTRQVLHTVGGHHDIIFNAYSTKTTETCNGLRNQEPCLFWVGKCLIQELKWVNNALNIST